MNNPNDLLHIKFFGIEALANGQFAITALVVIIIARLVARRRR